MLRSSQDFADWWPMFEKLQLALREAALKVWPDKESLLRDPNSQAFIKKFFVSVTEEEFSRGLLWLSKKDQAEKTLVFRRTLVDLASHAGDTEGKPGLFIDVKAGAVDVEAQKLLQEQLQMVPEHVKTITYAPIPWGPGIAHRRGSAL